jgi:hypothetical protein
VDAAGSGDLLAEHFFADPATWRAARPPLSDQDLTSVRDRVGKEIAHLTETRLILATPNLLWPYLELKSYALDAVDAFTSTVDHVLLSDRWKAKSA